MIAFLGRRSFLTGIVLLGASCVFTGIIGYTDMQKQREQLHSEWQSLHAQYKERLTLVPSLVKSTKELMAKDRKVYERLAYARKHIMQASNPYEESYAQLQLDSALHDVIAIADTDSKIPRKKTYTAAVRDLKTNKQHMAQQAQKI